MIARMQQCISAGPFAIPIQGSSIIVRGSDYGIGASPKIVYDSFYHALFYIIYS